MKDKHVKIFFGAGRIGKRLLEFGVRCGLKPDYFTDNNPELWGKTVENIPVISIEELKKTADQSEIFITCKDTDLIFQQLQQSGIDKNRIRKCGSVLEILNYILRHPEFEFPVKPVNLTFGCSETNVILDLSNGLVLGGVESWSIQTAEKLENSGYRTSLLTNNMQIKRYQKKGEERIAIPSYKGISEWERMECVLPLMVTERYNNIVCNFVSHNFATACLAKKMFPELVRVIAVIHNDETAYYQFYSQMQVWIDKCLVISKRIKEKILESGFPEEKLIYLPWEIGCEEQFVHSYSLEGQVLRIGYAGRIVKEQKRLDYLIFLAEQLKRQGIGFLLEVAGSGAYEEELKREIEKRDLASDVRFSGQINRSQIKDFWKRQDIMVSCSDWEGHSISQGEAMAAGAVPIITDVSGARDDVTDGENGFVVDIGAIDQIVEKICFLYHHREFLPVMGEKAYRTIKEKNNGAELEKLWKEILLG